MTGKVQPARAVLLAAGQGKRMKSSKPKVLHEVLGKAILTRVIDAVEALDIEHVHIVVGHAADQVRAFLEKNPPKIPYSLHLQEPQLGTGDALKKVVPDLKGFTGTLLVSVADTPLLQGTTLASLLEGHRREQATVTLLTTVVEDAKSYGRILRDEKQRVVGIIEHKDASPEQREIREINPAIYCFEWPAVQPGLNSLTNDNLQKEYYLTDLIGWAYKNGLPTGGVVADDWREVAGINSRLELAEANRLLRDIAVNQLADDGVTIVDVAGTWIAPEVKIAQDTTVLPGCYLMGNVKIGSGCTIGPHTVMHGAVEIGDKTTVMQSLVTNSRIGSSCRVGPFAHLRDSNVISDSVRVGNFVELKNVIVGDHTNVSHLSYVGDAELGSRSNIGAGTITANYNHVTKEKFRTVIGDDASTGSNSVLVAPVRLGHGAILAAGSVATKNIPDGALGVGRARQEIKDQWVDHIRRRLKEKDSQPDAEQKRNETDTEQGKNQEGGEKK
jgi:bifunctional UDP-N-acetylglucosamine pyrophosphorylase/glucosamine-1-phosphate N-acetyltransferase